MGLHVFRAYKLDEDGTGNSFETSQAETDTPTLKLTVSPNILKNGIIRRFHFRLNPTNAVTYVIRIYQGAHAGNYESQMNKLLDSSDVVAAGADDTEYDAVDLAVPFTETVASGADPEGTAATLYYQITWSGAPGDTTGYIEVDGEWEDF